MPTIDEVVNENAGKKQLPEGVATLVASLAALRSGLELAMTSAVRQVYGRQATIGYLLERPRKAQKKYVARKGRAHFKGRMLISIGEKKAELRASMKIKPSERQDNRYSSSQQYLIRCAIAVINGDNGSRQKAKFELRLTPENFNMLTDVIQGKAVNSMQETESYMLAPRLLAGYAAGGI